MKFSKKALVVLCCIIGMVIIVVFSPIISKTIKTISSLIGYKNVVQSTMSVLQSQDALFLVTKKTETQIVLEKQESSPFLGTKKGILICEVKMNYGIDLKKITEGSFAREGINLVITLPEAEEFDFSIDPNYRFIEVKSSFYKIYDYIMDKKMEDELRGRIKIEAEKYFVMHNMIPSKASIIKELENYVSVLSDKIGMKIILK